MEKSIMSPTTKQESYKSSAALTGAEKASELNSAPTAPRTGSASESTRTGSHANPTVEYIKSNLSALSSKTKHYAEDAGSFVRRYPVYSVLGAAALGTLLGMAISRNPFQRKSRA
jgi:ElaB/YqjD/DUF883 family membrane-anchored ribosome-binding protein